MSKTEIYTVTVSLKRKKLTKIDTAKSSSTSYIRGKIYLRTDNIYYIPSLSKIIKRGVNNYFLSNRIAVFLSKILH